MRKSLFAAVALAPLALAGAAPALAATTISSDGGPVTTSSDGDITVNSGVTLTATDTTPVVTINSNNSVTNSGTLTSNNVNGSVGVLIGSGTGNAGAVTGSLTNAGAINIVEDYTAPDNNNDGVLDGAWAKGNGRYGVRLLGPMTGDITNNGSIQVKGYASYGISIENHLEGSLLGSGSISVTGDVLNNAPTIGISTTAAGTISGKVVLQGGITANGQGAEGVNLQGAIGGPLQIYSAITATGYRVTTRSSIPSVNATLKTQGDLLQSGSALIVGNSVQGGIFLGAAPANTSSTDTTTDADGDGIVDSTEGTASLAVYGSAPALVIGNNAANNPITIGAFSTTNQQNEFGLIIRGTVTGSGLYDDNSATAIQIGSAAANLAPSTVNIVGGVRILGTVTAAAYDATGTATNPFNATGMYVNAITSAGGPEQLRNEGTFTVASTATASTSTSDARGIWIDHGGFTRFVNTGTLSVTRTGDLGSAYAFVDKSGLVSSVLNDNTIAAIVTPFTSTDTYAGRGVAFDLSNNTSGITFSQTANTNSPSTITPSIYGDIFLGSGRDIVSFTAGSVTGALSFGNGGGTLTIDDGATYKGELTTASATSAKLDSITVGVDASSTATSTLEDHSSTTIAVGALNIGAKGQLIVAADPVNNRATLFNTDTTTIAQGAQLGLYLSSLPKGDAGKFNIAVITASGGLSVPSASTDLTGVSPYLFVASFDKNGNEIDLNMRRRTAAEAGLNRSQASVLNPVYDSLASDVDSGIQRAFLAQTTQTGLQGLLNQMMPDHAGGVFRALSWAAEEQGVAAGDPPLNQDQAGPTRAWTNEIVLHEQKDAGATPGYHLLGFGTQVGVESVSSHGDALGAKVGFITANINNPDVASDNLLGVSELNAGVYWRGKFGPLRADAQLGVGFIWANSRRDFLYSDSTGVVHRTANAGWDGYTLNGRFGLAYRADLGRLFIEPRAHIDYFRLHESGYAESGGGEGFDLTVSGRTGDILSASGSLVAGLDWGTGFHWRPQVEVGYHAVLTGSAGDTSAILDGDSFVLAADSIRRNAAFGNIGLRVYSDYLDLLLSAGAEVGSDYTDLEANLTARTIF